MSIVVVWGTKNRRKKIGRVAAACESCDAAGPFTVFEVRRAWHLYFIPLGAGRPAGEDMACEACGRREDYDADDYQALDTRAEASFDSLMESTNPSLRSWIEERKQSEAAARAGSLAPDERTAAIGESLTAFEQQLKERASDIQVDRRSILALLGMCMFWLPVAVLPSSMTPVAGALTGIWLLLGIGVLIHSVVTSRRRWFEHRLLPILRRRLDPLKPTVDELKRALPDLRKRGLAIAQVARPKTIGAPATSVPATARAA